MLWLLPHLHPRLLLVLPTNRLQLLSSMKSTNKSFPPALHTPPLQPLAATATSLVQVQVQVQVQVRALEYRGVTT